MVPAHLEQAVEEAVAWLRRGGVVAYPTDTLYGLGADVFSPRAVARVFQVKGRPEGMALPVLLADPADLEGVAAQVPEAARRLARRLWPGPLTLVVRRHPRVPAAVTGGRDTVAVRVPDHPVPRALCRRLGSPITGTSANRSGGPDPVTAEDVRRQLGDVVDYIIDGGPAPAGRPSTIVDVSGAAPRVLRLGAAPLAALEEALGAPLEVAAP